MKRVLLICGGVIVVIVIAVTYVLYSSLDTIVAAQIENYGSRYTGTAVKVDTVSLDLVSGTGDITGFAVSNPAGFDAPTVMDVGEITLAVDVGSVTSDPVVIKEIVIDKPKVTYEIGPDGNNIDALTRHVEAEISKTSAGDGGTGTGDGSERKLLIENLYVRSGELRVGTTLLKGKNMTVDLENIHLRNIGKGEGGATEEQVAGLIAASLFRWLGVAIKGVDVEDIMKVIGDNVGGGPSKILEAGKEIERGAKGTGEILEKEAGETADKLKKLFK